MISIISFGFAGIVFLLGVIVVQLARDYQTAASLLVLVVFIASLILSAFFGVTGLAALARL